MIHPIHQVTAFQIVGPYSLRLRFENGFERTIDFSPVLAGELFGPLPHASLFRQVRLDAEGRKRLSGPTATTSIRRRSTTGRNTRRLSPRKPNNGNWRRRRRP